MVHVPVGISSFETLRGSAANDRRIGRQLAGASAEGRLKTVVIIPLRSRTREAMDVQVDWG